MFVLLVTTTAVVAAAGAAEAAEMSMSSIRVTACASLARSLATTSISRACALPMITTWPLFFLCVCMTSWQRHSVTLERRTFLAV